MAKKPAAKKPMAKMPAATPTAKPAAKATAKPMAAKKPAAKAPAAAAAKTPAAKKPAKKSGPSPASNDSRSRWFDAAHKPLIAEYAQRLEPYIEAMADGRIDAGELQAQEERLIAAMREVEPQLTGELHAQVTRLLCEMAAYDLMQTLSAIREAEPPTVFRG